MFAAVNDGTGPPSWAASVELWFVPTLVVRPMINDDQERRCRCR